MWILWSGAPHIVIIQHWIVYNIIIYYLRINYLLNFSSIIFKIITIIVLSFVFESATSVHPIDQDECLHDPCYSGAGALSISRSASICPYPFPCGRRSTQSMKHAKVIRMLDITYYIAIIHQIMQGAFRSGFRPMIT